MDIDFDSLGNDSPPSSPILGYSKDKDDGQSIIEADVTYCLNCKGALKSTDHSFSQDGYILRREVIRALENLNRSPQISRDILKSRLFLCPDGRRFNPLEKAHVKMMITFCRKNISCLEILSEHATVTTLRNMSNVTVDDPNGLPNLKPWTLRKSVCMFMTLIMKYLKYYRLAWTRDDFSNVFQGLRQSLPSVKDWSSVLQGHCGYREGNECSSAQYHFFHLQLELRWNLFVIFGAEPDIIRWVLDDMVQLAWATYNYKGHGGNEALDIKQPFNCVCTKEIWTMLYLVIEELKPDEKSFWIFYAEAIGRSGTTADVFFPIWLTANLAPSTKYSLAGVMSPEMNCTSNGYSFLHGAFKAWVNHGGKSTEVLRLSYRIFNYWDGDVEIIQCLWTQWTKRLDKSANFAVCLDPYSTVENWLQLISKLCPSSIAADCSPAPNRFYRNEEAFSSSHHDPFFEFVRLAVIYAKTCEERGWRKFKSQLFMKLGSVKTNEFGELGIIRLTTYILCLMSVVKEDKEAISLGERLQNIFQYGKVKDSAGRKKVVIRAYSCSILLLLQRDIAWAALPTSITSYMKLVDELLINSSSSSTLRKDLVTIYLQFLDCLPKHTPTLTDQPNLGRAKLISPNLLMWLSNSNANYIVRTMQTLVSLTQWIICWVSNREYSADYSTRGVNFPCEAKELYLVINEKCSQFLKNKALDKENRIPATDVEPLAYLAGDLTYLTYRFGENGRSSDMCNEQFTLFTLSQQMCPLVTQYYVERLFKYKSFCEYNVSKLRWTQVWLRLLLLKCSVPESLNEVVIGSDFTSTSNQELILKFSSEFGSGWSKNDLQEAIGPCVVLLKSVMDGSFFRAADASQTQRTEGEDVINSVITLCTLLLKRFDVLYIKGQMTSVGHEFLNKLVPPPWPGQPPWDKFSPPIRMALEQNIFDIFVAVVNHPGLHNDPFLTRKVNDIVAMAFFGFTTEQEKRPASDPVLVKIHYYCEDNEINFVLDHTLPVVIAGENMVKCAKLRHLFLRMVNVLRIRQMPTVLGRIFAGILRAYPSCLQSLAAPSGSNPSYVDEKSSLGRCLDAVSYCFQFGMSPRFKGLYLTAIKSAFEQDFCSKGKSFISLFVHVARKQSTKGSGGKESPVRRFLREEIVPLVQRYISQAEDKRGLGVDRSLRSPLEQLQSLLEDSTS